ncbi:MAG: NADH-quinone oxidoreductase subunit NuoK [bacterium]|jgi:NADH-quinone oxidoreductase subunit K|nr:NADH-quinone oxidoreductase subunit NuoK [Planctomycetota bacterium]HIL52803.1 NADH-quinone oxidoreductase subunit NuoK [Planctomycetota bacterium]
MNIPPQQLLILAGILFAIGVGGFVIRRNLIVVLMSIELMLNAANLTFIAASRMHSTSEVQNLDGAVFAIFVICVAAVEAAVGLALVIAFFRRHQSISLDSLGAGE